MQFNQRELDACGVREDEFLKWLALLEQHMGQVCIARIRQRHQLDISTVMRVGTCAALVSTLHRVSGFSRVAKVIARYPRADLWLPRGEWLQLVVAYIFFRHGVDIVLEHRVEGKPKDVVAPAHQLVLECKSFEHGGREAQQIRQYLTTGTTEPPPPGAPQAFTTMALFWPPPPGLPAVPILTNHYKRFLENAVAEKAHQLLPGYCNIVAVNTERIARSRTDLLEPLTDLLSRAEYPALSGFLLVEQDALRQEDYGLRGQRFFVSLVESRTATTRIPDVVRDMLEEWRNQGSAVSTGTSGITSG